MAAHWINVLDIVAEQLNRSGIEWMLVGSAATALRGAAITPGDIDITVGSPAEVALAATFLPTPEVHAPQGDAGPSWMSTVASPTLQFDRPGERWTFGLWVIDGFKVELAHIDSPGTAALWLETRSLRTWELRETLHCNGHPIPTVPIEPQLVTMMSRRQGDRLRATLAAIDLGSLNLPRLLQSIEDKRTEDPDLSVPEPVQLLLDGATQFEH